MEIHVYYSVDLKTIAIKKDNPLSQEEIEEFPLLGELNHTVQEHENVPSKETVKSLLEEDLSLK